MKVRELDGKRLSTAGAGVVVGAVLTGWEAVQRVESPAAQAGVLVAVAVAVGAAVWWGRSRQWRKLADGTPAVTTGAGAGRAPTHRAGTAIWFLLIAAVIGWDLYSFVAQSHQLPTLSYLVGRVTRFRAGRAAVFAAWILVGTYLALGWRRGPRSG